MLYMIIERFRGGDAVPVYRRFRDEGRRAPDGLDYLGSWVAADFSGCYQLMRCDERQLIDRWIAEWADLVEFEIVPVVTSVEAVQAIAPRL
ncbi:MAG TPA: DUF3303 family protein [Vicinamibacterales bacterium]|jgi:hypothetical protein|nr:DUF3303 family protein [Vicinamibacterales bacterium]